MGISNYRFSLCTLILLSTCASSFGGAGGKRELAADNPEPPAKSTPAVGGKECPKWAQSKDVPPCPDSDNGILPDNFPALAHVVSDTPFTPSPQTKDFASNFVVTALQSSPGQTPLMFLPMSETSYQKVRAAVEAAAGDDEEKKKEWLDNLVWVKDGPHLTWQQDYFESFNGPNGKPTLRRIRDYPHTSETEAKALMDAMSQKCEKLTQGEVLPPPGEKSFETNSRMGGNIEGLPGGLCLHGSSQDWKGFAEHYCGKKENEVVVDTDWLSVGHADEIVSTIRKPGSKHPCDFAIAIASPRRAMELMKSNPKDLFWDFQHSDEKKEDTRKRRLGKRPFSWACGEVHAYFERKEEKEKKENLPGTPDTPRNNDFHKEGKESGFMKPFLELFESRAWAGIRLIEIPPPKGAPKCNDVTNEHFFQALEDPESNLGNTNRLIQMKMDANKEAIAKKIKERLPQCPVEFIEVPNLFTGGWPVEIEGSKPTDPLEKRLELAKGMSLGLTPNPTNAVQFGNKVLVPHPQNSAFAKDIQDSYKKNAGMDVALIDSAEYAHQGEGNVHCASHSIRFCRGKTE